MKRLGVLFAAMSLTGGAYAATTTAPASPAAASPYVSIPFADHGGIRDWRADGNRSMWIEGRNGQWYYAQMFGPCFGLNFSDRIGFVVAPYGSFDRYSSVIVDGQKCMVESLRLSDPPSRLSRGDAAQPATS
jgi:hypothetical protein